MVSSQCSPACDTHHECLVNKNTQEHECVPWCYIGYPGCSDCYARSELRTSLYNATPCIYYDSSHVRHCWEDCEDKRNCLPFNAEMILPKSVCGLLHDHITGQSTDDWGAISCTSPMWNACNMPSFCVFCTNINAGTERIRTIGLNYSHYLGNVENYHYFDPIECEQSPPCNNTTISTLMTTSPANDGGTAVVMTSTAHRLQSRFIRYLW